MAEEKVWKLEIRNKKKVLKAIDKSSRRAREARGVKKSPSRKKRLSAARREYASHLDEIKNEFDGEQEEYENGHKIIFTSNLSRAEIKERIREIFPELTAANSTLTEAATSEHEEIHKKLQELGHDWTLRDVVINTDKARDIVEDAKEAKEREEELEKQVSELQKKKEELENRKEELENREKELESKVEDLEEDKDLLQGMLDAAEKKQEELKEERESLEEERKEIKNELQKKAQTEEEKEKLQERLQELKEKKTETENQLEEKEQKMENTKERFREIVGKLDDLEEEKEEVEEEKTQVRKEKKKVKEEEKRREKKAGKLLSEFESKDGRAYLLIEPSLSKYSLRAFARSINEGYEGHCYAEDPKSHLFEENRGGKPLEKVKGGITFHRIKKKSEIPPLKGELTYHVKNVIDEIEEEGQETVIFVELNELLENTGVKYTTQEIKKIKEKIETFPCIVFFSIQYDPAFKNEKAEEIIGRAKIEKLNFSKELKS